MDGKLREILDTFNLVKLDHLKEAEVLQEKQAIAIGDLHSAALQLQALTTKHVGYLEEVLSTLHDYQFKGLSKVAINEAKITFLAKAAEEQGEVVPEQRV